MMTPNINTKFCDARPGARRAEYEKVNSGTASVRAPRNAVLRTKDEFF